MIRPRATPAAGRPAGSVGRPDPLVSLRQRLQQFPSIIAAKARHLSARGTDPCRPIALWQCDLKLRFLGNRCKVFTRVLACEYTADACPLVYFAGMEQDPARPGRPNRDAYGPNQRAFIDFLIARTLHHARAWGGLAVAFSGSAYAGTTIATAAFAAARGWHAATLGAGFIDPATGRYECGAIPGDDGVNHWLADAAHTAPWDELDG